MREEHDCLCRWSGVAETSALGIWPSTTTSDVGSRRARICRNPLNSLTNIDFRIRKRERSAISSPHWLRANHSVEVRSGLPCTCETDRQSHPSFAAPGAYTLQGPSFKAVLRALDQLQALWCQIWKMSVVVMNPHIGAHPSEFYRRFVAFQYHCASIPGLCFMHGLALRQLRPPLSAQYLVTN